MQANGEDPAGVSDQALWQRSCTMTLADDEAATAARYLDLAGFADGRLDADDRERVAEWLDDDPEAATDVAAAAAAAAVIALSDEAAPESIVLRACALVGTASSAAGNVIAFPPEGRQPRARLPFMARWGSLAAAVAVAGWLGFNLGIDTSRAYIAGNQPTAEGFLNELVDTQGGPVGDLGDGSQT